MSQTLISVEVHSPPHISQCLRSLYAPFVLDKRIHVPVTHKYRGFLIRIICWYIILDLGVQEEVTREPKYPSKLIGTGDSCEE